MRTLTLGTVAALGTLMAVASAAQAAPNVPFTGSPDGTNLGVGLSYTGVFVNGLGSVGNSTTLGGADLWQRNVPNDHGLGVCSSGENCANGGGDVNELSQLTNNEAIVLYVLPGYRLTDLWVSSLDSGGTGGTEEGRVYYSNIGGSTYDDFITNAAGYKEFAFGICNGGAVECNLGLTAGQQGYTFYVFVPGDGTDTFGQDNDYLVWGASVTFVPEPASLALLGAGLLGLGLVRRRRA